VSPELLRAWERRYGLLRPRRSNGGLRLYSLDDLERVHRMRRLLADGLAAAEAVSIAARDTPLGDTARPGSSVREAAAELAAALDAFDEPRAQAVLDRLLATATVDAFLTEVVLPYLHELGERWERGEASIAQEHFASTVLRGRLLGLARGWGRGLGPLALLACLPREQHELGLIAFGLALHARGWRIAYLGADTPLDTTEKAAAELAPKLVALTAVTAERFRPVEADVRRIARRHPVALGGPGANESDAKRLGAMLLPGDPVSAAETVTARARA
jgi:methanogenic corrinoid protein MtbC1